MYCVNRTLSCLVVLLGRTDHLTLGVYIMCVKDEITVYQRVWSITCILILVK